MVLVDNEIKTFLINGTIEETDQTYIKDGDNSCITNIGYDLRAEYFVKDKSIQAEEYELLPGESIFVQTREFVHFDTLTMGRITLKNSRLRSGLSLDAPVYQPGHTTKIFFRLSNMSNKSFTLKKDEKYAMLIFEQLHSEPDTPYDGTYNMETQFSHLAGYSSEYADQIKSLDGKIKDIHDVEKSIYGNVITILSVFVAVFTLLNVNITLVSQAAGVISFLTFNLVTLGSISFLTLFLTSLLVEQKKWSKGLWTIPLSCFVIVMALLLFK